MRGNDQGEKLSEIKPPFKEQALVSDLNLINSRDFTQQMTPLHMAANNGKKSIVKLFISLSFVNKNPKTRPGFKELGSVTPYDLAIRSNYTEIAKILKPFQQEKNEDGSCNEPLFIECPPIKSIATKNLIQCYEPDLLKDLIYPERPFFPCFSRKLNETSQNLRTTKVYPKNHYTFKAPKKFQTSLIFDDEEGTVACFDKKKSTRVSKPHSLCEIDTQSSGPWKTLGRLIYNFSNV